MKEILEKLKAEKDYRENLLREINTYTPPQNYEWDRIGLQNYINGLLFAIRLIEKEIK